MAEELLKETRLGGAEELLNKNGEFTLLLRQGSSYYIINDRMGQRQHCFGQLGPKLAIAPTPREVLRLLGNPKQEIEQQALFLFLMSSKLRFHDRCIWKGCRILPPATLVEFNGDGAWTLRRYWTMRYAPNENRSEEEVAGEVAECFRAAVCERLQVECHKGITLTGGLDSRAMLGAIPHNARTQMIASTMGIPGCLEIDLARRVALEAKIPYRAVHVEPAEVFKDMNLSLVAGDDIDLIIQGLWGSFAMNLKDMELLFHGLDLDVTIGGIYLSEKLSNLRSWEELVSYSIEKNLSAPWELLSQLFRKDKLLESEFDLRRIIEDMLRDSEESSVQNTYDRFIMKYSMRRVILQRYRVIRNYIETVSPMYDRKLIDLYLSIPPEWRRGHRLFRRFLQQLCPELAGIPYQRTTLPPTAPLHFWRVAQDLESKREELYRVIAKETQGAVYVPYMRHYTNVDEWLRFDIIWKKACDSLLASPESILRREYVNPQCLDTLIREHRNHLRSWMKILHLLMSAEFFLRWGAGWSVQDVRDSLS